MIYVSTSDGKLRGLSLENGDERMPPIDFTTPFARNWSLNLIDGVIYSPTARGCGGAMSHFTAVDLKDPARKVVEYYTSTGRGGGAWGRGGLVRGPKGIYAQTADGAYDPAAGKFAHTVMSLIIQGSPAARYIHSCELAISRGERSGSGCDESDDLPLPEMDADCFGGKGSGGFAARCRQSWRSRPSHAALHVTSMGQRSGSSR